MWQLNLDHVVKNKMCPVLTGLGDASEKHRHELMTGSTFYSCLAPCSSFLDHVICGEHPVIGMFSQVQL